MSQIQISSNGWLAICFRNGTAGVFDLNDENSWQYLHDESSDKQADDEDTNDCNRNLIKFSPNGHILVFTGENKQVHVYVETAFEKTEVWWELQRIILMENYTSALELTNDVLFISDKNGDIYKINLLTNDENQKLMIKPENPVMKNISMLFDMTFIHSNDKTGFLLTTDQNDQICLHHYPNTSKIEKSCHGHTEFISHLKLMDNNHVFSASGDGTIRLWRLPDCVPLVFFHSKSFTLSVKEIFYTQICNTRLGLFQDDYRINSMPNESQLNPSSIIDYSIWNMDASCYNSDIYLAFSIYAHRFHSIYLTSLTNMKQFKNEERKLTIDISYGTIVDYCFLPQEYSFNDYSTTSTCYLFILFNSNILLKVDIISVLSCKQSELFAPTNKSIQEINNILTQRKFHLIDNINNSVGLNDNLYKQLFKNYRNSNENLSSKRKTQRNEQEQRKKQAPSTTNNDDDVTLIEHF